MINLAATSAKSPIDSLQIVGTSRAQILTINLEDYFQAGVFHRFISPRNWYRFESRLQQNTDETLALLDKHKTKATFFVLGWIADRYPELVRRIADNGHEIASRGFLHQPLLNLTKTARREDLVRSKELLEDTIGSAVTGFRLSDGWLTRHNLWFLNELQEAGYHYDSSLMPRRRDFRNEPWRRLIHKQECRNGSLIEVPPSTWPMSGAWMPIAGGNYLRQLPEHLMQTAVGQWLKKEQSPFVMYFQVWELDADQPRLSITCRVTRLRHYRNLGLYRTLLPQYFQTTKFTSIAEHAKRADSPLKSLHQQSAAACVPRCSSESSLRWSPSRKIAIKDGENQTNQRLERTAVTLVIPCYNEESSLPYLHRTLQYVRHALSSQWDLKVIFVDDCSCDNTNEVLHSLFGEDEDVQIVRHKKNRGVSAAILTGINASTTEIVASMDCDCSYDPLELQNMLPLMTENVAMVTASPYHREGKVSNVPRWRLMLSHTLSLMYRKLLKQQLSTWTSCFRIYRKRQIIDLPLEEDGFLGTAELAAQLSLHGRRIVEHPATLEVRLFGFSKMKTIRTILCHLRLLARVVAEKHCGMHNTKSSLFFNYLLYLRKTSSMTKHISLPSDQDSTGRTFGPEELEAVRQCLATGTLTSTKGNFVKQLETSFAVKIGAKFGYACSSGTAAVHCAVAALNPEPGDEIITTPITDMGALTPIIYQGAIPVFCDVDPHTYNVTAETIARCISPKTKAIIVTHLFGNPCDMGPIMELANRHGIPVIEDCAQAYLTTWHDQYVGTIGAIGCFSLQQGKHITTGEGGIVTTNDAALARRIFLFINKAWGYGDANADHYFVAPNYRMSELLGAVAVAQLHKLDAVVESQSARRTR
ncbi:MAG: DegT/DnrJ/EryC1/StrS family aminotransferase [Planctomycetaceae bacterium]